MAGAASATPLKPSTTPTPAIKKVSAAKPVVTKKAAPKKNMKKA
jgi:hypothetical protein